MKKAVLSSLFALILGFFSLSVHTVQAVAGPIAGQMHAYASSDTVKIGGTPMRITVTGVTGPTLTKRSGAGEVQIANVTSVNGNPAFDVSGVKEGSLTLDVRHGFQVKSFSLIVTKQ